MTRGLLRHHASFAAILSLLVVIAGLIWNTRVAAGADAYGYVSQADLWLRGDLFIDQRFGATVPWPLARWTFTPLGYRPEPQGYRIVPLYSPGLPMLMAAAKAIAGQCAIFWVVPLTGGVLVFATYWIGRRIGRPVVGLAAAWMVATSAAMLFMLMAPMSDVPAAAAWAVALACLLGRTPLSALTAGVAAAVAILIRPNLVPLAAVLGLWIVTCDGLRLPSRSSPTSRRAKAGSLGSLHFAVAAAVGPLAIAILNARLYGSAGSSGYGDLSDAYSLAYVLPNLRRYPWWVVSAETPLALAGLVCLAIPSARVWTTPESRRAQWLLAGVALSVWVSYLLFVPYDAWWYLRFLLPSWPMMAIGTASLVAVAYHRPSRFWRRGAVALMVAIGAAGLAQAVQRGVLSEARGEAKYIEVAKAVEAITSPGDVIITAQHSGSLRYYAGRLTLRWDYIDRDWFDRIVEWLAARGHHPYFVLEDSEIENIRAKFGGAHVAARLDWPPIVSFRGGQVKMYDAIRRERTEPPVPQPETRAVTGCLPQRPWPQLR